MKKYTYILFSLLIISCGDDFLTVHPTDKQGIDADNTETVLLAKLTSSYQSLLLDSYADNKFNSLPVVCDLRSDDIYKGGADAGDLGQLYRLSQLDASPDEIPSGLWNLYYAGLSRCNDVLLGCKEAVDVRPSKLDSIRSEAHLLRAYYVHWLWKLWGNIPYFEEELAPPYMVKQYKADEIYEIILSDINEALRIDVLDMRPAQADDGRMCKAAALMLKARVILHQKDQSRYREALADMVEIVKSGRYRLMPGFAEIWLDSGEFCDESIFESNQIPEGVSWASGWQGYGTTLPTFISPADLQGHRPFMGGWGFAPVRQETFLMYDEEDARRDVSIHHYPAGSYTPRFQDTGYFLGKYAAREGYTKNTGDYELNFKNNYRIFRYAETLLNIAELIVIHGVPEQGGITAQQCLNQIRERAQLPEVPATADRIKSERRKEFLGEGMRFWDLLRWGDTDLLTENVPDYSSVRVWEDYKRWLPIPQADIDKTEGMYKLVQNIGY